MPTYYVGPTAAGAADGSSWPNRYGSLNSAEDTPVVAGDLVYVGPGIYRERLILDVSGGAGTEIVYVADVTGENTDGIGGIVRITGSDDDRTAARNYCINASAKNYRVFRGFSFDTTTDRLVRGVNSCTNWTIEDCVFNGTHTTATVSFIWTGSSQSDLIIRRCTFISSLVQHILLEGSATNNANHLIENCIFHGPGNSGRQAIRGNDCGGITIRNCTFINSNRCVDTTNLSGGAPTSLQVNNCILIGANVAVVAANLGDLLEDFNSFSTNTTDRQNVAVGASSKAWPGLFLPPVLYSGVGQISGVRFPPPVAAQLSEWSEVRAIAGTNEPTEDYLGIARPVTAAKNSWGAVQFHDAERDSSDVYDGRAARKITGPGRIQFYKLVTGNEIKVSVRVKRDGTYSGSSPQMVIKQPGQADRTTNDPGLSEVWNEISDTFTPAAQPPYIVIELVSRDTNGGGAVFWDTLGGGLYGSFDYPITDRLAFEDIDAGGRVVGEEFMGDWKIIVPGETTNLVTNPSFETGTTGWATGGTNTIAQSTAQSKFGSYSLLCTYQDNLTLASYAITLTAEEHTFSTWLYIPSGYDGTQVSLDRNGFVGATGDSSVDADMTITDLWQRIDLTFTPDAGDLSGSLRVIDSGAPTAGRLIYLDAVQAEAQSEVTTYCDGDQDGCEWSGAAHASTSTRSGLSRAGGFIKDLKQDYYFGVIDVIGFGMPSQSNSIDSYAILPGGQLNAIKVQPRVGTLVGVFKDENGTLDCDINAMRQLLVKELAHDKYPRGDFGWQPVRLRYTRADVVKEIKVHYQAGLEANINFVERYVFEQTALRFSSPDPFWYALGQNSTELDKVDSATLRYVTGRLRSTGQWDDLGLTANPTGGGAIRAIAYNPVDGLYYVGGIFTGMDGVAGRDYIAAYDVATDTWSTVGAGSAVNSTVQDIAIAANGDVYIGGQFTNVGDPTGDYLAFYDISGGAWSPVSGGGTSSVYGLAFDSSGVLYFVGTFLNWNGIGAADTVASWDGSAYAAVGAPGGPYVSPTTAIDIDLNSGLVYVGGEFTTFAGVADLDYIAVWDGTSWALVGTVAPDDLVSDILVDSVGNVYATGDFTTIDGSSASKIAVFNGTAWSALGDGLGGGNGFSLGSTPDDKVIVGGTFSTAGSISTGDGVAFWNGSAWAHLDIDLPGAPTVYAVETGPPDPVVIENYNLLLGFDTTGTGTFSGDVTITNSGTTRAFPSISIERTGGTLGKIISIRNEDLGAELLFDYALLDGETLTIDLDPLTGGITSSVFGSRESAILSNSDRGDFVLQVGSNNITIFVTVAGGSIITPLLTFVTPYKSFD